MTELELARLRVTQLEKEIELEKLHLQKCEGSGQSVSNSENTILKNLCLPKREVLRFNGTPTNYWNFIRNFEEWIGSENIGFRAKLNYLVQYCDGEAKAAILDCTILEPEIGYHQALKLLEGMCGQKHVARTFIDNWLNFPNIRRNQPDGLRRLSREMQACGLTLEQTNYVSDLNSSRTIETVVLKLPTQIQQEWLKVAYKIIRGGREPLFTDLVEFVMEQAGIANTRYGLLVTGDPSNRNRRQSVADTKRHFDSGYKARVSFANTSESDVTPYREERGDNNNGHVNTQLCTEKSVERVQKQAAFAIVPVLVRNREKVAQTYAFLDNGSDASLVTEDLSRRLNLEREPKTISLKTLDNQSTIQCKEVQLEVSSLDSSSSFRIPNVWTVEGLTMFHRTVPTTSQMTSWTHLKDISFPRVGDENVKLLIGCNAPSVREMKEIRTGKPNEQFAVKTLSAKEELEGKFEQLYSTEFKDPFSRTISMSVEDRIALSAISNSVQRLNGHYQIALPWRHKHKLPNNRE
ncbi:unnamed protein product [Schistosoma mattheei]|uniref:Uncharacterized protein n=1 Tax=Schistosoma mattheei TaxID=31246 RepID=A0A183Q5Y1_9TREM|nr:unnamed protein product [Schistosoma mattheei]